MDKIRIPPGGQRRKQSGSSLIEVLVALTVVAIGLLGLAGLQARFQLGEFESYQRSQALLILQDMNDRMSTNRAAVASYVTASALGTGDAEPADCSTLVTPTRQQLDACEWSNLLKGAAEVRAGANVGAMIGARGCISSPAANTYVVTVVWQGTHPTQAPAAAVTCGNAQFNTGAGCVNELCRRAVSTVVRVGVLS